MNKIKKIGIVAVLALALTLSVAGNGQAALTLGATTIETDGAFTLTSVAGTTANMFAANTTGSINIGGTSQTSGVTTILGGTGTGVLGGTTSGIALTPGTVGTVNIGVAAGTGAITVGSSTAAQTVNIGNGIAAAAQTVNIANGASTAASTVNIGTAATGAGTNLVNIGGTNDASALTLQVGTGNFSLDGVGASTYTIGASTTSGTITIGGASQTAATTIYGGGTGNAVNVIQNLGTIAVESHGLSVTSTGTLASGKNLVGVNSVVTTAGSAGNWISGVYGQVSQSGNHVTGYISGGEFEVKNTSADAQNEMHALVLDSNNNRAYHPNSSYIWVQDFGPDNLAAEEMPNLFKITGATDGTGNMVYGSTVKLKVNAANQYLVMSDTENKLDLGDSSDGIDIGTAATGLTFTGGYTTAAIQLGTSGSNMTLTADDDHAIDIYTTSGSTSGSNSVRPIHMINTMTGAGGVGGRAEFEMTTAVELGGWANALKGYANFTGDASGVTGLASAICAEMKMPAKTLTAGNYAPMEIELVLQANSKTGGFPVSFMHAQVSGDDTAETDFNTNGYLFSFVGLPDTSGGVFDAISEITPKANASLKILIDGTPYYIPLHSEADFAL